MSSPDNPQFEPQMDRTEPQVRSSPEPSSQGLPSQDPPSAAPQISAQIEPSFSTPASYISAGLAPVAGRPPVENPVWSGWDLLLVVMLAVVTILVSQFAILFGAQYFFYRHATLADLAQRPILLLVSQFAIDAAVLFLLFLLVEGKYHVGFWNAIRWNWPRSEWKFLSIGTVMLLGLSIAENFLPMPKDTAFEKLFMRPRDAYLLAMFAVTLGPLVEELFFHGFLYPVLARRWGVGWGIFLTALPFGLMHLPQYGYAWGALLVILTVGVVCGIVRAATKSTGASFLVHVGYNGTQMLIAVVATHGFRHMEKAVVGLG